MQTRGAPVRSVDRSLAILEVLGGANDVALADIAARTGLAPSTAHRLLATLLARGYAIQSHANGRYMLGYKITELAGVIGERAGRLRALARPHLEAVREATGETASLSVLAPPNAVYIEQVEGLRSVRMLARIGAAVPAHASAAGKVLLAASPPDALSTMLGGDALPALTPSTITSVAALQQELDQIRRQGFAVDDQEHEIGVTSVAVASFDRNGAAVAISVTAPSLRIAPHDLGVVAELLIRHADALSQELGHAHQASANGMAPTGRTA